jgi:hypothetical protein
MSNGRTLVVIRVGSGSIIAALTDSALVGIGAGLAVIAAINTLAEFVKNLKKWFEYAKTHNTRGRSVAIAKERNSRVSDQLR